MGESERIMNAQDVMSSALELEACLVSALVPSKKGGETARPTGVLCHVTLLVNAPKSF